MLYKAHLWQVPAEYRGDQQLQNGVHHRSLQYSTAPPRRLPTVAQVREVPGVFVLKRSTRDLSLWVIPYRMVPPSYKLVYKPH